MVTDQIEQLKALQEILLQKLVIEQKSRDIPKNLRLKEELLTRIRDRYKNNAETKEKKHQELIRLRVELEQNERDREKTEGRIEHVNTQREYEALEKEIRERTERENTIREYQEVLKNEIIQLGESIKQELDLTHAQEKELEKEEKDMDKHAKELKKELEQLETEEMRLARNFSTEFLFKFRRIISTIDGHGIVSLVSNVCGGCHMILPNHIVNDVRREEELFFCPYCSKVLYYSTPDSDDGEEPIDSSINANLIEEFGSDLSDEINFDDLFEANDTNSEYQDVDDIEEDLDGDEHDIRDDESDDYGDTHYEDEGGVEESVTDSIDDSASENYVTYEDEDFSYGEDADTQGV